MSPLEVAHEKLLDALREWRSSGHGFDTHSSTAEEVNLGWAVDEYERALEEQQ